MNKLNVAILALAAAGVCLTAHASEAGAAPITDAALTERSANMPVYADASAATPPRVVKDIGFLSAAICSFQGDAPVSPAAALSQLRADAARRGADAITNLRVVINANSRSACWRRGYTASGEAVVLSADAER
jgi:hypothetical protein